MRNMLYQQVRFQYGFERGVARRLSFHVRYPPMTYVVTYIDAEPGSTAQAAALIRKYRSDSGSEDGNSFVHTFTETHRRNRFVIVEGWLDEPAFQQHEAMPGTLEFRSKLAAVHNSPADQRVHHEFAVAEGAGAAAAGAVSVVTHVDVPPPRREETEALLRDLAARSRSDDGNLRYDVFQQNAPRLNHFTVFAEWRDAAAFAAHEARQHTRLFREALGPMLGAPYDERWYTRLD
jgi:quinol monooxygenase YgiN